MKKIYVVLLSIATGLIVGGINGFLGAGGGMILVPMLTHLLKDENKVAHSTAVFVILPICVVSGLVYLLRGAVDFKILLPVAIGTLAGGIIGTFLLNKLRSDVISFIFWIVMIGSGLWVIITSL